MNGFRYSGYARKSVHLHRRVRGRAGSWAGMDAAAQAGDSQIFAAALGKGSAQPAPKIPPAECSAAAHAKEGIVKKKILVNFNVVTLLVHHYNSRPACCWQVEENDFE